LKTYFGYLQQQQRPQQQQQQQQQHHSNFEPLEVTAAASAAYPYTFKTCSS
jgi:hypothetical protein